MLRLYSITLPKRLLILDDEVVINSSHFPRVGMFLQERQKMDRDFDENLLQVSKSDVSHKRFPGVGQHEQRSVLVRRRQTILQHRHQFHAISWDAGKRDRFVKFIQFPKRYRESRILWIGRAPQQLTRNIFGPHQVDDDGEALEDFPFVLLQNFSPSDDLVEVGKGGQEIRR